MKKKTGISRDSSRRLKRQLSGVFDIRPRLVLNKPKVTIPATFEHKGLNMAVYILGAIIFALAGIVVRWMTQDRSECQADRYRFVDAVLLMGKYLPWFLVGAIVGLGIVWVL